MKNPALWIGCFIAAALLLLVAGILWLSGGKLFQHNVAAVINFKDGVTGLYKGAPVTFRGVPLGEVTAIELEIDPKTAVVRIPVHVLLLEHSVTFKTGGQSTGTLSDLRGAVREGLRAKLVLQSIVTGQKAIDLNIIPDAPPVVTGTGEPVEIPVVAADLAALEDQLANLPVRKIAQELLATLQSVQTTLATANSALGAAGNAISGGSQQLNAVGQQAQVTLATADTALARVQHKADQALTALTRLADNANGTATAIQPDLLRTLSETRTAAESARLALGRVAGLTAPDGPFGDDLRGSVSDLAQAARSLRDLGELLDQQPNALVFGRQRLHREAP